MIILPVNLELLIKCLLLAIVFEFFRVIIAYFLARPSSEISKLEDDKEKLQIEIRQIKSVQLEFVKHSLLSRKIIAIEKKIDGLQFDYAPKAAKVKKLFRVLRLIVYVGVGVLLGNEAIVLINPQILWPLSWFTSSETIGLPAWFMIFTFGALCRHTWRTVLPVLLPRVSLP